MSQPRFRLCDRSDSQKGIGDKRYNVYTMCTLQSEGIVYTHEILSDYRSKLNEDQLDKDSVLKAIRSLSAYLTIMAKKHAYKTYTQPATRYGRDLYNKHIFNPQSIPYIYNLKLRQWQMESELNELRLVKSECRQSSTLDQ